MPRYSGIKKPVKVKHVVGPNTHGQSRKRPPRPRPTKNNHH